MGKNMENVNAENTLLVRRTNDSEPYKHVIV